MNPGVAPVLNEPVQVFKKPPERSAHGKKQQKKTGVINHHAASGSSMAKCIDYQDKRKPQWSKGVGLKLDKPGKPCPRRYPGNNTGDNAQPPPPGESI
jgi:hypothetical protein